MDFGPSRQLIDEPGRPYARALAQAFPTIGDPAPGWRRRGCPATRRAPPTAVPGSPSHPGARRRATSADPVGAENAVTGSDLGFCGARWLGSGRIVGWLLRCT